MDTLLTVLPKIGAVGFGLLLLAFLVWVIKRTLVNRRAIPPGVAAATRAQLMEMLNAEQQAGLEHQMYMEEEERREDDQGADE